ncbi:hypothetical protein Taro_003592, partial [Colocasia esculenta]|nr:hypothetical protein [Colocasia esculenta]
CNKPGHMKGECPENKKDKYKKINKLKKPKAMVATWSDDDPSEDEEEKSSSTESEEICLMANSTDGKVDTRDLSQGIDLPVWDSVSTHLMGRSTHSGISVT